VHGGRERQERIVANTGQISGSFKNALDWLNLTGRKNTEADRRVARRGRRQPEQQAS
jgi:hypothetical protein